LPIAAEFAAVTVALPQDKTLVLSRQGEVRTPALPLPLKSVAEPASTQVPHR
jgi:hypothetical protein